MEVRRIKYVVPIVTIVIAMLTLMIQPAFSVSLESSSIFTDGIVEIYPLANEVENKVIEENNSEKNPDLNGKATLVPTDPSDIDEGCDGAINILPPSSSSGDNWTEGGKNTITIKIPANTYYCLKVTTSSTSNPNKTLDLKFNGIEFNQTLGSIDNPGIYYYYTDTYGSHQSTTLDWGITGGEMSINFQVKGFADNVKIQLLLKNSEQST